MNERNNDQDSSQEESDSNDNFIVSNDTAYSEALSETRNNLEKQHEIIENTNEEILTILRINLLIFGGVVTLIASVPDLISNALPWVILSGVFLIVSILILSYIYRSLGTYLGFGDQGYDKYTPNRKIRYDSIIQDEVNSKRRDKSSIERESLEKFRQDLLNEHKVGITHNNFGIKYRNQIQQQVTILLLFGIILLGLGIVNALSESPDKTVILIIDIVSIVSGLIGFYVLIETSKLLCQYIQIGSDQDRLSYDYGFEWGYYYSYISRICQFIKNLVKTKEK